MHQFIQLPSCSVHVFQKKDRAARDQFAQTPASLLNALESRYGAFDFDPCPVNPTFDGLQIEWGQFNYVNPPFNNMKAWISKSICEWRKGKGVILLMPIRIHTAYFLDLVVPLLTRDLVSIYIIRGGVKFQNYEHRAPFGMMFLHFPRLIGLQSNNESEPQSSQGMDSVPSDPMSNADE